MAVKKKIISASKVAYSSVEKRLSSVFKPVPPRSVFVDQLGRHIRIHPPAVAHPVSDLHFVLIMLAGIFSLVALLAVGVRAVLNLGSTRRRSPRQA